MKGRVWTAQMDALLGTLTDREVGQKLGIHQASVRKRRMKLGIAPERGGYRWSAQDLLLLGTMSDREVGTRLGVSGETVRQKRLELRIPTCPGWRDRPRKYSDATLREVIARHYSLAGMAQELGISKQRAHQLLARLGMSMKQIHKEKLETALALGLDERSGQARVRGVREKRVTTSRGDER